jgi:hypothetical protein
MPSRFLRPLYRILGYLLITLLAGGRARSAAAQAVGCNLAPDPAFEQGPPTSIDGWRLAVLSGAATFAVSNYPDPVQSGARAARVDVSQSGDLFLHTAEPGEVPVVPGASYRLSVRLRAEPGKTAGIRVIEWSADLAATADRFLASSTGTGDWETVEGGFTATPATAFVSIRLMHHMDAGTFYWDDPMLWRDCDAGGSCGERCMDVRHYLMQTTPGFRMCLDIKPGFCTDAVKLPGGELLREQPGARDYIAHTGRAPGMVGVVENFDTSYGAWRCFTDPGEPCGTVLDPDGRNPRFPPTPLSLSLQLPVLDALGSDRVTPGAVPLHGWQLFDVRNFKPDWSSGPLVGTLRHRTWAFLLSRYTFSGNLGTQENVLVIESESIGEAVPPDGLGGGVRLERYLYVRGFGLVYGEGREDPDCEAAPGAATCDGVYPRINPAPPASFTLRTPGDYPFSNVHPPSYNVVDWW